MQEEFNEYFNRQIKLWGEETQNSLQNKKVAITDNEIRKLDNIKKKEIKKILVENTERNSKYFDDEVDKLDKWSEDKRKGLKAELKDYDDQIAILKKEARLAANLPDKLTIQKKLRDLDKKRDVAWKTYDEEAKQIEKQKDTLIDSVEKKLK